MVGPSSLDFELRVEGLTLRLRPSGPDHEDWLSVFVEVSAEPFGGSFAMEMLRSELTRLLEALQALDQAVGKVFEVRWKNYEGNVELVLSLNSRGNLIGNYRFSAGVAWAGPMLSGQFRADQSYLRDWLQQLERIVRALG
jgi:hypothetical protein